MRWIRIKSGSGQKHLINVEKIVRVVDFGTGGIRIHSVNDHMITTKTYDFEAFVALMEETGKVR